ncbi:hypothetical protein [Paraburkholderia ginsengisoli]|uniref:Transmembrane protein n=1 Tax=Paraburkholderia ginsengisoli TaxID=311231 RepID=A0A7T4N2H2_9BURK|nr:hypothetical protein [Paraburkholderia ginsengisoli]QQC64046.1 hypothetical protein I6I06_00625 [Paraburkholderia ginsengisoli]
MNFFLALEIFAVTLALLCVALVPVAIGRDPGLMPRIVRMDAVPKPRWPNLLMRTGVACVLMSFALLVGACYYILADALH